MNQILTTKQVKQKKPTDIKTVKRFFAISLIIFGICLLTSGSYAMYKSLSSKNQQKTDKQQVANKEPENENAKLQIDLTQDGTNVVATLIGEKEIDYVTYKWDDEDETRENIGDVSGKISVEIPAGEHTLSVTAVDVKNNTATKVIKTKGYTKPKIETSQEGKEVFITISDEFGLEKIELKLNQEEASIIDAQGAKEKKFKCPLESGENTLEVTAYNQNGYKETSKTEFSN